MVDSGELEEETVFEKGVLRGTFSRAVPIDDEAYLKTLAKKSKREEHKKHAAVSKDKEKRQKDDQSSDSDTNLHFAELIADLERQVRANNERIELLNQYHHALSDHLQKLLNGEEIEVNSDGSLRDEMAEAAIREYEEKYGQVIDRYDPGEVKGAIDSFDAENQYLRKENSDIVERVPDLAHLDLSSLLPDSGSKEYGSIQSTITSETKPLP